MMFKFIYRRKCVVHKFLSFIYDERISSSYKYWCREESYFVIRKKKQTFFFLECCSLCYYYSSAVRWGNNRSTFHFFFVFFYTSSYLLVIVFCCRRLTSHTTSSRRSSFSSFTVRAEVRSRVPPWSAGTAPATQLGGCGGHLLSSRIRG